jgi:hypothetical protein
VAAVRARMAVMITAGGGGRTELFGLHNPLPEKFVIRAGTRAAAARFLNERRVWSAASSNGNGEDGRKADPMWPQSEDRFRDGDRGKLLFLGGAA